MFVACSTLCFGKLPLTAAIARAREFRFQKLDLAVHAGGPHLTPAEVAADVSRVAQGLRAFGAAFSAVHLVPDEGDAETTRVQVKAVARLARVLAAPVVTVRAAPLGSDLDADARRLADWNRLAVAEGVILSVETNRDTLTADPRGAAELCRRVPGLGVTLDPSHYLAGPHGTDAVESLYPHVQHVRLRDTGKAQDAFQVRIGQGAIDYGRIVTNLERVGYNRCFTVDVRDCPEPSFAVEPEVRTLKYLLESLL